MKIRVCGFLVLVLPALMGLDLWRASNKNVERGNAKLRQGQAKAALELYDKALAEDGLADQQSRAAAEFNRGAALAALKQNDEASQAFLEATKSKDVSLRARAFYNLGNTFFQGEKFAEAVEAYKRSLVLDSRNADAKWNLELALRSKREQDEKNEKDKGDQDKDKQDKDKQKQDKGDQDKGDQDKGDQDKGDQDKGDQDKQDDNGQKQPPEDDKSEPNQNQDGQDEDGKGSSEDEQQPQPNDEANEPPPGPQPPESGQGQKDQEGQEGQAEPADMKEINAILDSLEQSPQEMERQRARMRAVRRRPPVKDW